MLKEFYYNTKSIDWEDMEQEEAINPGLAIWVLEYEFLSVSAWKVDGIALDGYYGFGSSKKRLFKGDVVCLTPKEKIVKSVSISMTHFSRSELKWQIKNTESLPKVPFLITDNLETEMFFNGYINLEKKSEVINKEEAGLAYSVATKKWFGFLTVQEDNKLLLSAFSSDRNAKLLEGEEMWSFEWECLVGRLKLI